MATLQPRYDSTEFARRGKAIYQEHIVPKLQTADMGKFVAIDIETGTYAIDRDDYAATEMVLAKVPDAQIWLERAGQPTAYKMGGRPIRRSS